MDISSVIKSDDGFQAVTIVGNNKNYREQCAAA